MQPELFQNLGDEPQPKGSHPSLFPHRYLRVRVAYEDLIFVSLSLVMVLLGGFCLGVERGKRLSSAPVLEKSPVVSVPATERLQVVRPHLAAATTERLQVVRPPIAAATTQRLQVVRPPLVEVASAKTVPSDAYVIQCASFRDSRVAQEESVRLRRQGFDARVVKQGRYYELRVVGYRARAEALDALPALKKTYQDGFVKRLSSG